MTVAALRSILKSLHFRLLVTHAAAGRHDVPDDCVKKGPRVPCWATRARSRLERRVGSFPAGRVVLPGSWLVGLVALVGKLPCPPATARHGKGACCQNQLGVHTVADYQGSRRRRWPARRVRDPGALSRQHIPRRSVDSTFSWAQSRGGAIPSPSPSRQSPSRNAHV